MDESLRKIKWRPGKISLISLPIYLHTSLRLYGGATSFIGCCCTELLLSSSSSSTIMISEEARNWSAMRRGREFSIYYCNGLSLHRVLHIYCVYMQDKLPLHIIPLPSPGGVVLPSSTDDVFIHNKNTPLWLLPSANIYNVVVFLTFALTGWIPMWSSPS